MALIMLPWAQAASKAPPRDYEAGTVGGWVTVTTTSALIIIDTWDYEASTVGKRETVTTTSALLIIDLSNTRWKAT